MVWTQGFIISVQASICEARPRNPRPYATPKSPRYPLLPVSLQGLDGGFSGTRKPRVELVLVLAHDAFPDDTTDVRVVYGAPKMTLNFGKWQRAGIVVGYRTDSFGYEEAIPQRVEVYPEQTVRKRKDKSGNN